MNTSKALAITVVLCTTILFSSVILVRGIHDTADAGRRQAAARCIDSWHAWVRGTHTRVQYPDIEYCMLLSGVKPPEGMADKMWESDKWLREQEEREAALRHEEEKKLGAWMTERDQAEEYFKGLCDEDSSGSCLEALASLVDRYPR